MSDYRTAMAIGAHPDDIEFLMAGTLLRLKDAGIDIHMWNLANGNCGTAVLSRDEIIKVRWEEARASAALAGATIHPPIADDLALFYEPGLISRVAAVIREVRPDILLVPSPEDYMEDHQNACRLAVTGAFARGMKPYETTPPVEPWDGEVTIYHAPPNGLRDPLRRVVLSEQYVDVTPTMARKREMLSEHRSQKEWLDASQGMDSYIAYMDWLCAELGKQSGKFEYAEGWRRRLHYGFCAESADPMTEILGTQ